MCFFLLSFTKHNHTKLYQTVRSWLPKLYEGGGKILLVKRGFILPLVSLRLFWHMFRSIGVHIGHSRTKKELFLPYLAEILSFLHFRWAENIIGFIHESSNIYFDLKAIVWQTWPNQESLKHHFFSLFWSERIACVVTELSVHY